MRRTKADAELTRIAILDEAVRLFAEKGVAETSLEEIARAANVTRGAVYWHFKNKMEIFDALHERLYQPLSETILNDMERDHPHPLQKMESLCIELLLDVARNKQKQYAITLFLLKMDYSGELQKYRKPHRERKLANVDLFRHYFEQAIARKQLSDQLDPATLAMAVRCYLKGIVFEYLGDPESFEMNAQAPILIHIFFGTMLAARNRVKSLDI
jgi:AcrR family transcriptional regulator